MSYGRAKVSVNEYGDITGRLVIKDSYGSVVYDGRIATSLSSALATFGWAEVPDTAKIDGGWRKFKVEPW